MKLNTFFEVELPERIKDHEVAWTYLETLDMSEVKTKLLWENETWCEEHAERAIYAYKMYVMLQRLNTDREFLVPHLSVDAVWHLHLQYTKDYLLMCAAVIGRYLNHNPGSVKETEGGQNKFQRCYARTNQLTRHYFGESSDPQTLLNNFLLEQNQMPYFQIVKNKALDK